jgi:hypothetical protein
MANRKPQYFRIIFLDRDAKEFGISGIITDDTLINEKTCKLQEQGKNVNVTATNLEADSNKVLSKEEIIREYPNYKYNENLKW